VFTVLKDDGPENMSKSPPFSHFGTIERIGLEGEASINNIIGVSGRATFPLDKKSCSLGALGQ
jgi:hypothetical protein